MELARGMACKVYTINTALQKICHVVEILVELFQEVRDEYKVLAYS